MHLYLDTETVGLQGNVKLIQYSYGMEDSVHFIKLYKGWQKDKTIRAELVCLMDMLNNPETIFVAYNAQYDLFKLYMLFHKLYGYDVYSREEYIKPFKCQTLDLQVTAMQESILAPFAFKRAGKSVARVTNIPTVAKEVVKKLVLNKLVKKIPKAFKVKVSEHEVSDRKDLVSLSFNLDGRVSLKGLMAAYGLPTIKLADVWPLPNKKDEKPYLPYSNPEVHDEVEERCEEVMQDEGSLFYAYSKLDIVYLKILYLKLNKPEVDYNSELTHNGAYVKYFGYAVDKKAMDKAEKFYGEQVEDIETKLEGINPRSSKQRLEKLKPFFPLLASTDKASLKVIANLSEPKEGVEIAQALLEYGSARQRLKQIEAVQECKTMRAHPELRVMGTATNRMAGTSGINWQGIGAFEKIEGEKVGLRHAIFTPLVGDWSSFEVRIAAAVYEDENLQRVVAEGLDMHSYTSALAHPEAIRWLDKEGIEGEDERYKWFHKKYKEDNAKAVKIRKQVKAVVFGIFYGAQAFTVSQSLGITETEAQKILDLFFKAYPGILRYRQDIEAKFLTVDTEKWTRDSVEKMEVSLKDLTGFERRWDFEKEVATIMWELGHTRINTGFEGKIVRKKEKGLQTINNACKSALLGSAIAIQSAVSRQAVNFRVQATGSSIHKQLQAKIWTDLRIGNLSVHDELFCIDANFDYGEVKKLIHNYEQSASKIVPELKFDFGKTKRWSDK